MANVSLAEKRVPLDGRINVKVGEKGRSRVSTLPTVHGEYICILDKESLSLDFEISFFPTINLPLKMSFLYRMVFLK